MGKSARLRLTHGLLAAVALYVQPAQAESPQPGTTPNGLAGIVRAGVPAVTPALFSATALAGAGYTEAQNDADRSHLRVSGSGAFAVSPVEAFQASLLLDGRYDRHPDDGSGSDDGMVGVPVATLRAGARVGGDFRVGAEAAIWLQGADAPSLQLDATTVDAKALAAWVKPDDGLTVALNAGYRIENGQNAIEDPARLRFGDRLALGLSQYDAVLLALGTSIPATPSLEVLLEGSHDFLIGGGAPGPMTSPMRASVGARYHVSPSLELTGIADVSLSKRPTITTTSPLIPVEPRAMLRIGLAYHFPVEEREEVVAPPADDPKTPEPVTERPVATTSGSIAVTVADADGKPVPDVAAEFVVAETRTPLVANAEGVLTATEVRAGAGTLVITAPKFRKREQAVTIAPGKPLEVAAVLEPAPPEGQLRGLIRSFRGKGIAAKIHVDPTGAEATADAEGAFELDVPPGTYTVTVTAPGFRDQERTVKIEQDGVTILNAELHEGK